MTSIFKNFLWPKSQGQPQQPQQHPVQNNLGQDGAKSEDHSFSYVDERAPAHSTGSPAKSSSRPPSPTQRSSNPGSLDVQVPVYGQKLQESLIEPSSNVKSQRSSRSNKRAADDVEMIDAGTDPGSQPRAKRVSTPERQRQNLRPGSTKHLPAGSRVKATSDNVLEVSIADTTTAQDSDDGSCDLYLQPDTRPITVPQLIQEVKGIYAGLVMVEKKCIEIVQQQSQSNMKLSNEQWQALIALHRTLLNEHHDFFAAAYHPSTKGHELRKLAANYAMPARMWRHGIHAFLELLRHRLPDSLDHMLSFVYLAYSMMALLMETIDGFEETWIECLGDLARYRMAIEEADLRDREIWSNTARRWYDKAADLSPYVGRIQHHLAVLARPNIVQQQFLYSKALVSAIPFKNAGDSIMLLFNPLLEQSSMMNPRYPPAEAGFVTASAILFTKGSIAQFKVHLEQYETHISGHLVRLGSKFKVQGPELASAIFAVLFGFGQPDSAIWTRLLEHQEKTLKDAFCERHNKTRRELAKDFVIDEPGLIDPPKIAYWTSSAVTTDRNTVPKPSFDTDKNIETSAEVSSFARHILFRTISEVADRIGDKNVVPFMHVILAMLWGLTWVPHALISIEACIPWLEIVKFLNTVGRSGTSTENFQFDSFPKSFGGAGQQLPEDFVMRGLMPLVYYFPKDWFTERLVDEDERLLELPSHQAPRVERCLYCGVNLAKLNRWISYDSMTQKFSALPYAETLLSQ